MSQDQLLLGEERRPRRSLTPALTGSVFVACMGALQFGYHMAELNAPQEVLMCHGPLDPAYADTWWGRHGWDQCLHLNDSQYGLVTSIFSVGGLVGSLCTGSQADRYGRRPAAIGSSVLAAMGSAAMVFANSYAQLLVGRLIVGVGCGGGIVVTSLMLNEMAPTELKGALGALNQTCINLGILVTQLLAFAWANSVQWRLLFLAATLVAAVHCALLLGVDESPRWLAANGDEQGAERVLRRLRAGDGAETAHELREWRRGREHEAAGQCSSLRRYMQDARYARVRGVVAVLLMGQQFCGINSIVFYGVKLISGALPELSIAVNFGISVVNLIVTLTAAGLVDRLGRRPLLQFSAAAMAVASTLMAAGILLNSAAVLVVCTFAYIMFFALGFGPIPFLIIAELSSPGTAAVAQSYGIALNWVATFIVGFGFPILNKLIGGYVFAMFGAFAAFMALYVRHRVPETRGKHDYREVWQGF
ncbi:AaceriAFL034Wp [[Ashbya] aceris (nom. inval.)]|nr:AaceriAFL034Wp [[Ashbya] aceris (nom. inval.)]